MATKVIKIAAAAAIVTAGAYWYWSPFWTIHSMTAAAQRKDADAFNERVDYPRLRESFKGQVAAMMAEKMGLSSKSGSDMERAGAAIGSMLGMALVDRFVDAMVRPEVVMRAMQEAKVSPNPSPRDGSAAEPRRTDVQWSYERKGVDKLIAYAKDATEADDTRVGLVFERSGFATWKLTEIRLPSVQ